MKATIFKIALLIIAIIVGFMYYGCDNNPCDPVEETDISRDLPMMEIVIHTETSTERFVTQRVTYFKSDDMLNIDDTSGCGESFPIEVITGFEIYPLPNK